MANVIKMNLESHRITQERHQYMN